jgi:glycosyltransferase involved in cell wall biosynthesis
VKPDILILGADDPLAHRPGGWQRIVSTYLERCSQPERHAIAAPGFGESGRWLARAFGGRTYQFFGLDGHGTSLLPSRRLRCTLAVARHYGSLRTFDTVYSHGPELLLPFVLRRFPGRLVLHVLGGLEAEARYARNPLFRPFGRAYRRLAYWVMGRCSRVIWVDATQIPHLPLRIAELSEALSTFYDPSVFRPREESRRPGPPRLVVVARLTALKRVDVVLRALAESVRRGDDWRLTVCGSGDEESALRSLALQLEVDARVEWQTGHLASEELAAILRDADVGLLVSASEGSPSVVKEMLASGVPVVVSNVGDNSAVVADGVTGIVLDRVDAETVYLGVCRALSLGDAARVAAVDSVTRFGADQWTVRLESLLIVE